MVLKLTPERCLAIEYSDKALAYAQAWAPVIRPMGLPLFHSLPLRAAGRILDVGTGTGALLPDLRAVAPDARIIGVDLALGMLRVARERSPATLATMDAQRLAFRSESFDCAVAVFVLFHVPDPMLALTEILRVLKEGGMAGVVTWGRDPGVPGQAIWTEELDRSGAKPDPRDPSVMQHERMDSADKLDGMVREAGFETRKVWSQVLRHLWTPDRLFDLQIGCGMASRRLSSLVPMVRAECSARVRARIEKLSAEQLIYEPEVVFLVARKRG